MSERRTWGTAAVVAVAVAVVAGAWSWVPSAWSDEAATVSAATRPLRQLPALVSHIDLVNAAYFVAMHGWFTVVGVHDWTLRLPSVVGVAVAVLGTVVLGTRLSSLRIGVFAGVLTGVVPQALWAATEARSYAWTMAFAAWLGLLLVMALEGRSRWRWVAFGALAALAVLLFIFMGLLLVAFAVSVVTVPRWRARWRPFLLTAASVAVVTSPFALAAVGQRGQVAWLPALSAGDIKDIVGNQWFGGRVEFDHSGVVKAALAVTFGALALVSVARARGTRGRLSGGTSLTPMVTLALAWLAIPTLLLVAMSFVTPVYAPRYVTFCVPAVGLLAAPALARLGTGWRVAAMAVIGALVLPIYITQRTVGAKWTDWSTVASEISAGREPNDAFYVIDRVDTAQQRIGVRSVLELYPDELAGLKDVALVRSAADSGTYLGDLAPLDALGSRLAGRDRLWLVVAPSGLAWQDTPDGRALSALGYQAAVRHPGAYDDVLLLTRASGDGASS